MSRLQEIAQYIVEFNKNQLSNEENKILEQHFLDTIGALIVGRFTTEGEKLFEFGENFSCSFLDDISIYSSMTRLTDIDDIHLTSCTTPGSVIVPVLLHLVPFSKEGEPQFIEAMAVGYELLTRLGKAIEGPTVIYEGIWPTYFCAAFGAAATASRLLNLTKEQVVNALSFSLLVSTGGVGGLHQKFPSRWMTLGNATRAGCLAALTAKGGFNSDEQLLNDDWFQHTYGLRVNSEVLTKDLGTTSVWSEMSIKPYCSAKQILTAVYAVKKLFHLDIQIDEIEQIEVYVPPYYAKMIDHDIEVGNRLSTITSAPYQLASVLIAPERLYDVDRTDVEKNEKISHIMKMVKIIEDETLTIYYPKQWAARVRIITKENVFEEIAVENQGDPGNRFTQEMIVEKFLRFTQPYLGAEKANKIMNLIGRSLNGSMKFFDLNKELNTLIKGSLVR